MLLLSKGNLIVEGNESIILIDVNNRTMINEFKYDISIDEILCLSEKKFLYFGVDLEQYELEESNNIKLKEKNEKINGDLKVKYPENKLITYINIKKLI